MASLDAEEALLERVEAIVAERDRVVGGAAEQGWSIPEPRATSCGCPLGERTAELVAAAEEAGITVRPFAGEGVRVTIGEPEANDVFLAVAESSGSADPRCGARG